MPAVRLPLVLVVVALPAFSQALTPPPAAPPPDESPPSRQSVPPAALKNEPPPVKYSPGWAREGGAIGFGVSVVPLGLSIAAAASQWSNKGPNGKYDLTLSDT